MHASYEQNMQIFTFVYPFLIQTFWHMYENVDHASCVTNLCCELALLTATGISHGCLPRLAIAACWLVEVMAGSDTCDSLEAKDCFLR